MYLFDRVNLVTGECFNDRAHIVYVNSEYNNDDAIGKLLHDLRCSDPNEMYYDIIRKDTAYLKTNDKEMKKMSGIVEELINEGRSEGRLEGISIGEQRGYAQAEKKYQAAEKDYIAQLEALKAENARLKAKLS